VNNVSCLVQFAELFRSASKPVKNGKPTNVLITGGSNGIGRSLALRYARPGSLIALTGRNTERLNAVAAEVRALGAQVLTSTVDVADEQAMATFVLELDTKHPLDLVIANAGVHASTIGWKGLEENTRQLNAVNVQGVYNTVMPLIERFKQRKAGQLAVVASLGGFFDIPRAVSYAAGKSGLIVFCRGLRHALTPFGVRVNTVASCIGPPLDVTLLFVYERSAPALSIPASPRTSTRAPRARPSSCRPTRQPASS